MGQVVTVLDATYRIYELINVHLVQFLLARNILQYLSQCCRG